MTQIEIALLIISSTISLGGIIAFLFIRAQDRRNQPVVHAFEVHNGTKLVSTTYNTYIGKNLVKSETITY